MLRDVVAASAQDPPAMTATPVGRAIVDALEAEGVTTVFGIPGGHILPIYDAVYWSPRMTSTLVRHEHAAAAMAAAYAQLTGTPGAVLVTAGPGVTNVVTAVAEAYLGALPMIILAGRGSTATVYRGASQEVGTDQILRPVTKWSARVDRADLVVPAIRQAFAISRSGKPGPVLIEVPRDILAQRTEISRYVPAGAPGRMAADPVLVSQAAQALAAARRPLLIAGGGVLASAASAALVRLAEQLFSPVLTSLAGRGAIPEDHPLAAGGLGAHRNWLSKQLLAESDVIVGLGARFEEMETNWQPSALPPSNATYIQVDIDPSELGRSVPADIVLAGDLRTVLEQILAELGPVGGLPAPGARERAARVAAAVAELDAEAEALASRAGPVIHPAQVIRLARRVFPQDTILGVDVGVSAQQIGGAFPFFRVYDPRSTVVPSSFYGMGFVTAAIPAAGLVHPGRPVLCFTGDGSFQMVSSILQVAAEYRLAVTWCVLNDDGLGSIWDIQHHTYQDRIIDTVFPVQPDLARLARSSGCYGERVEAADEVEPALTRALKANSEGRPAVADVRVSRERLNQTIEHYVSTYPQP
jgi:acetolactate synthase-1/2/3 large subunit